MKAQSLAAQALHLTLTANISARSAPVSPRGRQAAAQAGGAFARPPAAGRAHRPKCIWSEPTQPRRVQHGLFTPAAPEPEKLELTLGKIRGWWARRTSGIRSCSIRTVPARGSLWPTGLRCAFRYFRPPLEARVEPRPEKNICRRKCFKEKSCRSAGPWRSSGDWWQSGCLVIATNGTWHLSDGALIGW